MVDAYLDIETVAVLGTFDLARRAPAVPLIPLDSGVFLLDFLLLVRDFLFDI